jgi:large subunit ribosomal protein L29
MKVAEIRDLETAELHGRITELKEELFNLRFQLATGQLDNHRRVRACKTDIARIRTVLRERDYAAASVPASESAPVSESEGESS